jgi:hypothetical protein
MKFIATKELGRLAKWLRTLGFDTQYYRQDNRSSLIINALRDDRIILTRLTRFPETHGLKILHIKSDFVKKQISQAIIELDVKLDKENMFSRCTLCNQTVVPIEKEKIKEKVPEYVYETQEHFSICSVCGRVYWQGSHWGNVNEVLASIRN